MADVENATQAPSEKKFIVALLLCLFLGAYGAHRFYTGKTNTAIVMLVLGVLGFVTLGITSIASGIWALVDLIQICIGNFKTQDGDDLAK